MPSSPDTAYRMEPDVRESWPSGAKHRRTLEASRAQFQLGKSGLAGALPRLPARTGTGQSQGIQLRIATANAAGFRQRVGEARRIGTAIGTQRRFRARHRPLARLLRLQSPALAHQEPMGAYLFRNGHCGACCVCVAADHLFPQPPASIRSSGREPENVFDDRPACPAQLSGSRQFRHDARCAAGRVPVLPTAYQRIARTKTISQCTPRRRMHGRSVQADFNHVGQSAEIAVLVPGANRNE